MQMILYGFAGLIAGCVIGVFGAAEGLSWSSDPGCHERLLKRRYGNPLFPADRREVGPAELQAAQEEDRQAAMELARDILKLELPDDFPVGAAAPWLERINDLRHRSVAVGGDVDRQGFLHDSRAMFIDAWRAAVAGNTEALARLEEAERFVRHGDQVFMNENVAQLTSCTPAEDVVPSLLTFDVDTLQLVRRAIGPREDAWRRLRTEARRIAQEVWALGEDVPGLQERLEYLESE